MGLLRHRDAFVGSSLRIECRSRLCTTIVTFCTGAACVADDLREGLDSVSSVREQDDRVAQLREPGLISAGRSRRSARLPTLERLAKNTWSIFRRLL